MRHGGDLTQAIAHYGGAPQDWLDLSTGINPWPWPLSKALGIDALHRLPSHADEEALVVRAAEAYKAPPQSMIVPAPGTQALIQWLPHLAPEGNIAILGPTYSEHAASWRRGHRTVSEVSTLDALQQERHVLIVNPNNPDGRIIDHDGVKRLAEKVAQRGGWLMIDESFADLDPAMSSAALCEALPILVLRSFGKFYGLPGLRLGFLIASSSIATSFQSALGPWSVSTPSLVLGAKALADHAWADATRMKLAAMAQRLDALLNAAGFHLIGGTNLFRYVHHADAKALHEKLARSHIWCRRFDEFKDRLRFGLPRDDQDLTRLKEVLLSL